MAWELDKTKQELQEFYQEVFVENKPRYTDVREWLHLWVDFWNSFFDMNYTLGHIVAIGLPILLLIKLF